MRQQFRIRFLGTACVLALAVLTLTGLTIAQVAPTTIFQLNGNAANDHLTCTYGMPCDYWNLLNGSGNSSATGGVGTNSDPGHSSVRTFISGMASTNSFTGGGSKDPNLLSQWTYASHNSPDKDTINAAYAAAYQQGGDFELIFGADRLSPNGDANIGIWFFQQNVQLGANGNFIGAHVDHDIFIVSAFTGGGGTSNIAVYDWDHTCAKAASNNPTPGQCAAANLRLLASAAASSVCGSAAYCAITNAAATTSTWEGSIGSPLFFEGGIDLSYVLSQAGITQLPCFSSFLVETRSSQSPSSVLKDFVLGGFPVCGIGMSKNCGTATVSSDGTSVTFPVGGAVTNTGVGTLYNVTVFDTVGNATSPKAITVTNNTTGSPNFGTSTLGPAETGAWSDSSTASGSQLTQSDTAYAQAALSSATTPNGTCTQSGTVCSTNKSATCSTTVSTSLTVSKNCNPGTSLVGAGGVVEVQVGYSGQVCNQGSSRVTNVTLTDYPGTSTSGSTVASNISLAPHGQTGDCVSYSGSYTPTSIDITTFAGTANAGTGPGRYFFNDLVAITGATPTIGTLTILTGQTETRCNNTYGCAPASCPICQGAGECTQ